MLLSKILILSFLCTVNCFNWTGSKIARMNQQIILEVKKLRQLQVELATQTKTGHLVAFKIVAITSEVIIVAGIIFSLQACWTHSHHWEIEDARKIFYDHWVKETTYKEEISGIPMIDFTYHKGHRDKFNESLKPTAMKNKVSKFIYFGYAHLLFSSLITAGTLHAIIWWSLITQPLPSILVDFCMYDLALCRRRCRMDFDEEYPAVVTNNLILVTKEVKENYDNYLSILEDKRTKVKWATVPVCLSYVLLLVIALASALNSFLPQLFGEKSHGWKYSRSQRKLYLLLDVISAIVIILLYLGIFMEHTFISRFNLQLKRCRQQLHLCYC